MICLGCSETQYDGEELSQFLCKHNLKQNCICKHYLWISNIQLDIFQFDFFEFTYFDTGYHKCAVFLFSKVSYHCIIKTMKLEWSTTICTKGPT